ncbi:MAG: YceG family protein, partial [Bacillota bacterium]|nr:YceG family protein [Bacillota bacterium]
METSKYSHCTMHLKESENIFTDILSPLAQRGEGLNVYFYRIIGCDDEEEFLAEIANLDEKLRSLGSYILFKNRIEVINHITLIEQLKKLLEQVPLKDFSNGAVLNLLESHSYFSLSSDFQASRRVKDAFGVMLNLYLTNDKPVNVSIVINFITKILLWLEENKKKIYKESPYNPKIIYWGSPKSHEIYFLILMSLIGCDILVLNTSFNDRFEKIDPNNKFSFLIRKAYEQPISAFPATRQADGVVSEIRLNHSNKLISFLPNDPVILVKLKKSETLFEEIMVPLDKRIGFVGRPSPILPTFFVRYIGVPSSMDDWKAEYFNSLFNLDKALEMSGNYLKFLEGIPAPNAAESRLLSQKIISNPYQDLFEILEHILQANILLKMNDELLDNTVRKVLVDTVNLFAEKNSNLNPSIVTNFSLKLVTWFNRYLPKLFDLDFKNNPKVLFYGTIKPHEIYLLDAFHQIGCDVLFVHSAEEGDKPFQIFDKDMTRTHLIKNDRNLTLASFPEKEQVIRKSTIAYKASREIEEVIYSEEVGLFRPWQFENYLTQPITLKTTYDELKILWREPSKLRPEFKVQNKKVYIPNLFAKINGVSEDIDSYWKDFKVFLSAPNTKLIQTVPFTQTNYTKQELFQADYLLNAQGLFDEIKVRKSRHYKFGYLKIELQIFLISKMNELISSGMFINDVDEKFKLRILMTILTMEDSLTKLIEVFDYPQEIPKVIVYNNKKEMFSSEDAILLSYFNLIGIDIVIFTPTNYLTIENHLKPDLFDIHQLSLVKYDLALPLLDVSEATVN